MEMSEKIIKRLLIRGINIISEKEQLERGLARANASINFLMEENSKLYSKIKNELPKAQKWIPFDTRPLTEEEKAEHPELSFIIDGEIPEEGQRILVNVAYKGHEAVQLDMWGNDGDGCYLDSGYDIGTEVTAWMPLPEPYKD